MSRARIPFTQAAVKRAVGGALACGLKVAKYEVDERGKITVFAGDPPAPLATTDFDSWKAKRDARSA
jgi:hypothetical protein